MSEHSTQGAHAVDTFRITKIPLARMREELGPDDVRYLAAQSCDNLVELASCDRCTKGVPVMVSAVTRDPDVAALILHLVGALTKANQLIIQGSDNYDNCDPQLQAQLREAAGHEPIPDYMPDL